MSAIKYIAYIPSNVNLFFTSLNSRFSQKPLSIEDKDKLGLAQYYMVNWSTGSSIEMTRRTGNYLNMSTILVEFTFQRRVGFFILQVNRLFTYYNLHIITPFNAIYLSKETFSTSFQIYFPLTLIVCLSWLTFWLTTTKGGGEIAARTMLGATTVLAVVTIGFGGKSKPQVNKRR